MVLRQRTHKIMMNLKKVFYMILLSFMATVFLSNCKHQPGVFYNDTPAVSIQCSPDTVYFQNDILPLLVSSCSTTGCHDKQTGKNDVVLVDYNSVMKTGGINPDNPGSSKIYEVIVTNDERMPPPPSAAWPKAQADMLYTWIAQGAINNQCSGDSAGCDTTNVTFKGDVRPIFQKFCYGCHNSANPSGNIDLTNWDQLALIIDNGALVGSIKSEPGYSPMPKGSTMTNCEILTVEAWANDTVINSGGGGGGGNNGIACDPDTTYFQNQVLPLLVSNCATTGCHNTISHKEGVILVDYSSVMQTGKVIPGNPNGSKLYKVLFGGDREDDIMPPPPSPPFTTVQKGIIRNWILQGAKNNYCNSDCDTTNVTFSGSVWPIIQTYCLGCHNGGSSGGGISLRNYSEVAASANSGKLLGSIRYDAGYSPMPKYGQKLSDCKISEIRIWIEDGTPNN